MAVTSFPFSADHELSLVEDRERIAIGLNDEVIQRIFAAGLSLLATSRLSTEPMVVQRIEQICIDLDGAIDHVRSTVFHLQRRATPTSVRSDIVAVCAEATTTLGFDASCRTSGPIDSSVPDVIAGHIISIVREALSNVARHARASKVDVVVVVDNWRVLVEVTDDGAGLPAELVGGGHGLENMLRRAAAVGGSLTILDCITGGTRLTWEAPLISASAA